MSPIERAIGILRDGGLVAFPTETVYGLGADARNEDAVARIFAAKGRPSWHPLIVHLPKNEPLDRWAREIPDAALVLAERFWPGPLTLIVHKREDVPACVTGGQETIALRVPDHPVARELLARFRGGIAAPSANRFGSVSATRAEHVRAELADRVDFILDGGPSRVGLESTIVDVSGQAPRLLRPGAIAREAIEAALGVALGGAAGSVRAPGMLASHYAPRARVIAVPAGELADRLRDARSRGERAGAIASSAIEDFPTVILADDPEARAHGLYAALREADALGLEAVVVAMPEEVGIGAAIADRLRRASASRDPQDE